MAACAETCHAVHMDSESKVTIDAGTYDYLVEIALAADGYLKRPTEETLNDLRDAVLTSHLND